MYLFLKNRFKNNIFAAIVDAFDLYLEDEEIMVNVPDISSFGNLSTSISFKLAKTLKKSPKEISLKILESLFKFEDSRYFDKFEVAGNGYINVYFNRKTFILGTVDNQPKT